MPTALSRRRSTRHAARLAALALLLGVTQAPLAQTQAASQLADDAALARTVAQRVTGDRSGACLAVAVVRAETVKTAHVCADPTQVSRITGRKAFEIGSVSKTMTAALLATELEAGRLTLDTPLAALLPADTVVPQFQDKPIRLQDVVTHRSGLPALPSRMPHANPFDPYATLDTQALLGSLADVKLTAAPGTEFLYSNFASMVLSWGLAHHTKQAFPQLLQERLLTPLNMADTFVGAPPPGVTSVAGHESTSQSAMPWNFADDMAGVGGVRSTLDDMVRYVRGQLGDGPPELTAALTRTQQPLTTTAPPMGMNWMIAQVGAHTVQAHEGATGGFSSFVGLDRQQGVGVVILSDTSWVNLGGVSPLGLHLLAPDAVALDKPRRVVDTPAEMLESLPGSYVMDGGLIVTIVRQGKQLAIQAANQPAFVLGYDDAGDFYPLGFDARLDPESTNGRQGFVWHQGGAALAVRRVDTPQ
ncbi:beta-lactamase family protein [Pigmentiphaga aceris]|uniref:Beta-lactamase n=1 Tax=Pigmentiphaga aceris TaxID=1940612 RepID=A0A5C0ATB2_9BURK|nr:serine hydrolase domain-containing protein [Pigmentiphaga aceris]QEI04523.1 beta-lactamase family protein [Pigmentiphaga aceris]